MGSKFKGRYSLLYENDHFNQAQAEFKKMLNGQSMHAAQKKGGKKKKKGESQGVVWYTHSKRLTIYSQHCPYFTIRCMYLISH